MSVKRLCRMAVLTAVALGIYIAELQIPSIVPIPGVKLGLANIVTIYAIFKLSAPDAAAILTARILLGSIFAGQVTAFFYSAAGGLMCLLVMLVMRKIVTEKQIWVCSVIGAVAHNIGQIAAAIAITQTLSLIYYLPVLLLSGIITGLFTGLSAQFLVNRLPDFK